MHLFHHWANTGKKKCTTYGPSNNHRVCHLRQGSVAHGTEALCRFCLHPSVSGVIIIGSEKSSHESDTASLEISFSLCMVFQAEIRMYTGLEWYQLNSSIRGQTTSNFSKSLTIYAVFRSSGGSIAISWYSRTICACSMRRPFCNTFASRWHD